MIPVLTKDQAYKLDKDTIESGHLSQKELMDNAGRAVAQFFCEKIKDPFNQKVLVICGKGNNGGDAIIAHSYLKKYNVSSKIVFTEKKHEHSNLIKKYKIPKSDCSFYSDKINFDKYDWIIDGIFGVGLSRDLNEKYERIIKNLNENNNILSIDISSGKFIDSDKSRYFIKSKHIVTFGYPKLAHYLNPVNSLFIIDIGLKNIKTNCSLIELDDVLKIVNNFYKKQKVHKYNSLINIRAGSKKYPGAAVLCCKAAQKTGSKYISLYPDDSNDRDFINLLHNLLPEVVIDKKIENISQVIGDNPFLTGPGLKKKSVKNESHFIDNHIYDCINYYESWDELLDWDQYKKGPDIDSFNYPTNKVVDAESLSNIVDESNCILTPHVGELKRMLNKGNPFIFDFNLLQEIQNLINKPALKWGGEEKILILKSFNTFIITKDMIYIMDKGPSSLATAGTGDVLSGILVSLLSQGYSRLEASILGTYLHAEAANYYMNNISKDGMTASNLIDCIPHALNVLRKND